MIVENDHLILVSFDQTKFNQRESSFLARRLSRQVVYHEASISCVYCGHVFVVGAVGSLEDAARLLICTLANGFGEGHTFERVVILLGVYHRGHRKRIVVRAQCDESLLGGKVFFWVLVGLLGARLAGAIFWESRPGFVIGGQDGDYIPALLSGPFARFTRCFIESILAWKPRRTLAGGCVFCGADYAEEGCAIARNLADVVVAGGPKHRRQPLDISSKPCGNLAEILPTGNGQGGAKH